MWQLVFLTLSCDLAVATAHSGSRKGMDIAAGKKQYQVQHGACSYTFLLPETDHCRSPPSAYMPNAVQRDAPLDYDDSVQRLQVLENIMENNTQWLMKQRTTVSSQMGTLTASRFPHSTLCPKCLAKFRTAKLCLLNEAHVRYTWNSTHRARVSLLDKQSPLGLRKQFCTSPRDATLPLEPARQRKQRTPE
ncbi:hypothetical protein FD754_016847 [Muntiacus muntjak]|uniref:Uncharacterized protein n=1 Tax=Muntiacus muntjak TaxID=9888 RepID=A0A5N3VRN3_MUNMU|nr:hypothetical protein FD754_016847 [Muntiacus muntjak]